MRAALLAVLALALAGPPALAHHGDTLLSYVEASGTFDAGLVAVGVEGTNLARAVFAAHPCHPDLQVVLGYTPENTTIGTDEAALVLPHRFQLELFDDATGEPIEGAVLAFERPGPRSFPLPPEHARGGPLRADLYMTVGAPTDWDLSVRGWLRHEGCVVVSEVEADPLGPDAGNEWVELANLGFGDVDVSGWTLRATHGTPAALTLPQGTVVPGAGHLVVGFPTQFLDNVDEVVVLEAPDGVAYATTPALSDGANDVRTQQLAPETSATWVFRAGTPGLPN